MFGFQMLYRCSLYVYIFFRVGASGGVQFSGLRSRVRGFLSVEIRRQSKYTSSNSCVLVVVVVVGDLSVCPNFPVSCVYIYSDAFLIMCKERAY